MDSYGIWVQDHSIKRDRAAKRAMTVWRPKNPREAEIRERRAVVRQAYFLIRDDKDQIETTRLFALTLGGKNELTDKILGMARRVIGDHRGAVLQ